MLRLRAVSVGDCRFLRCVNAKSGLGCILIFESQWEVYMAATA